MSIVYDLSIQGSSRKWIFLNTRNPEPIYKVFKLFASGRSTGYCANIFERYEKCPIDHAEYDFNNMWLVEFAMLSEPYDNRNRMTVMN